MPCIPKTAHVSKHLSYERFLFQNLSAGETESWLYLFQNNKVKVPGKKYYGKLKRSVFKTSDYILRLKMEKEKKTNF